MSTYLVTIADVDSLVERKVEVYASTSQEAHKKAMFEELANFELEEVVQIADDTKRVVFCNVHGFIDFEGDDYGKKS